MYDNMKHDDLMRVAWRAVRKHSGLAPEDAVQAYKHGADAGWSGFIYYSETDAFYEHNAELVEEILGRADIEWRDLARPGDNLSQIVCRGCWAVLELVGAWIGRKWEEVGRAA